MFQIHPPPAFTPLAPRNPNTCPYFSPSMSTAKPSTTTTTTKLPPRHPPPPPRLTTQNPFLHHLKPAEKQQQRRRQAYLGKVRQASDDQKWESRSELILRAEFLSRQRAWEAERAREAAEALPAVVDEEEEEEDEEEAGRGPDGCCYVDEEVEMVDRILSQEEEEFEALVERMQHQRREEWEIEKENYGSEDDEVWERLFREVVDTQDGAGAKTEEGEKLDKGGDGDGDGDGDGGMDMS